MFEQRFGVSTSTQRAVDNHLPCSRREHGHRLLKKDGFMIFGTLGFHGDAFL
jgi:hypothetical protein